MSETVTDEMVAKAVEAMDALDWYNSTMAGIARAALSAAVPLVVAGERERAFSGFMDAYECWVLSNSDPAGKMALGNAIAILYPEFRDEARRRASAIRSDNGGETNDG